MTKKDYNMIARILLNAQCARQVSIPTWQYITLELAAQFKETDSKFNHKKFLTATGYGELKADV